jgi:hypothetical protein
MRPLAWLPLLVVLSSCSAPAPAPEMPPFQTTANMKDLMLNVIDPAADTLWESVGTVLDEQGTHEKFPATDDEWDAVKAGAIQLAEAGNLLLIPARSGGSAEWIAEARALIDASNTALRNIEARDKDALFTTGGDIYDVCTNCHKQFAIQLSRP